MPGPETPMKTSAPTSMACRLPRSQIRIGHRRQARFVLVHVLGSSNVERTGPIASDESSRAGGQQDLRDRHPRRADAAHDNARILDRHADHFQRVLQRAQHHDGRAVLIVVHDRDVQLAAQALFDDKTLGRRDVLQIDAAEDRRDLAHGGDDLVRVLAGQADRKGVQVAERLEDHALALHDRLSRRGADVAQAEHRRAVADHRDRVALDGQGPLFGGIVADGQAHAGNAGRVDHAQVVARLDRDAADDFDLAAQVDQEGAVADVQHADAVQRLHPIDDRVGVNFVAGGDGQVTHHPAATGPHDVEGADVAADLADGGRQLPEHARPIARLGPQDEAVAGTRLQRWLHEIYRITIDLPT